MHTPKIALAAAFAVGSLVLGNTGQTTGPDDRQIDATPAAGVQTGQSDAKQYGMDDKEKKLTDRDFVKKAASGGMYEIESAKLAAQKLDSDQHKQHAQKIQQDHQRANEQLKQIAQQKNIEVPSKMDDKHEKMLSKLRDADDEKFSKLFAQQQVKAHKEAIKLHEKAASDLQDQELKQFAQQQLPVLQEHLAMLQADHAHALLDVDVDVDVDDAQPAGAKIDSQWDRDHKDHKDKDSLKPRDQKDQSGFNTNEQPNQNLNPNR